VLWILFVVTFPAFGLIAFILFGINTTPRKGWEKQYSDAIFAKSQHQRKHTPPLEATYRARNALSVPAALTADPPFERVLDSLSKHVHPLLGGNDIRLIEPAEAALEEMFAAIQTARHHIHLTTYIFADDMTGRRLMRLLVERAKAGVQVRVLYDGFGSAGPRLRGFFWRYRDIPNLHLVSFSQANILKQQFQLNLRNHRKILVVDGRIGFTGGVNFHDAYLPRADGRPGIIDYHFAIRGPLVLELQYTFLRDWFYMSDKPASEFFATGFYPSPEKAGDMVARLVDSNPVQDRATNALNLFFAAVTRAKKQILLVTPYFVPSESLMLALCQSARRGVDVKILVPALNNHPTIKCASHALYDQLLLSGVHIYERHPPFIHAKAAVFDGAVSIIGSANLDPRSLSLNYETVAVVESESFTQRLKGAMLSDFSSADEITYGVWRTRPRSSRIVENFFNLFHPIA
jgi:cardiolipin synthase